MSLEKVGNFFGGLLEDGMAGYIEIEKAKAASEGAQAASQDATFDSPEVDENPRARPNQSVATTTQAGGSGLIQSPTAMVIAGGLAVVGVVLIMRRR